jgi:hypothetical protein
VTRYDAASDSYEKVVLFARTTAEPAHPTTDS